MSKRSNPFGGKFCGVFNLPEDKKPKPWLTDEEREEAVAKHLEFQKKLSKILEESGMTEVPKEEGAKSEYTISFSNSNRPRE
jgi:hypothetical protein